MNSLLALILQSLRGILDRINGFLEDDLLRRMLECLLGKPTSMRQRPMAAPSVDATTTQ
jgi:hypothetical protein